MFWECVMPSVVTLLAYKVALFLLSGEYVSFLRSGRLGGRDALVIIGYSVCVITLSLIVVAWFSHMGGSTLILLAFFTIALSSIFVKSRDIGKLRENVTLRTCMLDGEKVEYYAYSGSYVNAFYSPRYRRIYIHERLERLLSEDELRAIIYHERRHGEQVSKRLYSKALNLAYVAIASWIFAGLVISALANYIASNIILFPGVVLSNVLAVVSALVAIYFILVLFSLIVLYLRWVWEHDADLYAARKVGAEVFAKALVKVYLSGYLADAARYIPLESLFVDFKLEGTPPLTWRDVFRELLRRTLSPRGLVDAVSIVIKPLEETHPSLHLRLRAVRAVINP